MTTRGAGAVDSLEFQVLGCAGGGGEQRRISGKGVHALWFFLALAHDLDVLREKAAIVPVLRLEPGWEDIEIGAFAAGVRPDRLHLVDPFGGNDDVARMELRVDSACDPAEDNRIDMEPVDDELGAHRGVDHADTGEAKDIMAAGDIDFIEAAAVDRRGLDLRSRRNHLRPDRVEFGREGREDGDALQVRGPGRENGEEERGDPEEEAMPEKMKGCFQEQGMDPCTQVARRGTGSLPFREAKRIQMAAPQENRAESPSFST